MPQAPRPTGGASWALNASSDVSISPQLLAASFAFIRFSRGINTLPTTTHYHFLRNERSSLAFDRSWRGFSLNWTNMQTMEDTFLRRGFPATLQISRSSHSLLARVPVSGLAVQYPPGTTSIFQIFWDLLPRSSPDLFIIFQRKHHVFNACHCFCVFYPLEQVQTNTCFFGARGSTPSSVELRCCPPPDP